MALLGANKKANATEPKKRSIMGTLFNPHLGESIRPMGQALSSFVRTIAMVFAISGLYPKDHPAFKDDTLPLSLPAVLRTAWARLSFTKQGLPKVLLFFAVAGGLALLTLSIIMALLVGLSGHAHAATASSVFTTQNPDTDLAYNWLEFLFNPSQTASTKASTNLASVIGVVPPTTVQQALGTALGIYSGAILIIAAIILFYHLAAMIVETAHSGVPMGKRANQIWAPIRLVVAIGLLVPIGGMLNSGQFIVLKVAEMGSALASYVWSGFVTSIIDPSEADLPPLVASQDATSAIYNLTMMHACEYDFNYRVLAASGGILSSVGPYDNINGWVWDLSGTDMTLPSPQALDGTVTAGGKVTAKYSFSNKLTSAADLCGYYLQSPSPTATDTTLDQTEYNIYMKTWSAFRTAEKNVLPVAAMIQSYMVDDIIPTLPKSGTPNPTPASPTDLQNLVNGFQTDLVAAVAGINKNVLSTALQNLTTNSSAKGWAAAGAIFNTLVSTQAELNDAIKQSIPKTVPPSIDPNGGAFSESAGRILGKAGWLGALITPLGASRVGGDMAALDSEKQMYISTMDDLGKFSDNLESGAPSSAGVTTAPPTPILTANVSCGVSDPVGCIFIMVDWVATTTGVWQQNGGAGNSIGVQFPANVNPLLAMSAWGHNNISAALTYFNLGIYAMAGTAMGKVIGNVLGSSLPIAGGVISGLAGLGGGVAAILFFFGVLFFTLGATIAYFVPLLPFMHFFFNTITWVSCVAEAIVAIPMVALAHLNPEGEGISGQAKGAYTMIFSVMLRPVLMIFGLICGLLIMYVAVGLLNALYATAVATGGVAATGGTTSVSADHMVVSHIIFSIIYVVILYSVANHAFALIGRFPNQAMEWMGAKGLSGEKMGDPGHIGTAMGVAEGYLGSKFADQLQSVGRSVGEAGQSVGGAISSAASSRASDRRHDEMLDALAGAGGGALGAGAAGGGGAGGGGGALPPPVPPPAAAPASAQATGGTGASNWWTATPGGSGVTGGMVNAYPQYGNPRQQAASSPPPPGSSAATPVSSGAPSGASGSSGVPAASSGGSSFPPGTVLGPDAKPVQSEPKEPSPFVDQFGRPIDS